jgi:hypothetical protein
MAKQYKSVQKTLFFPISEDDFSDAIDWMKKHKNSEFRRSCPGRDWTQGHGASLRGEREMTAQEIKEEKAKAKKAKERVQRQIEVAKKKREERFKKEATKLGYKITKK